MRLTKILGIFLILLIGTGALAGEQGGGFENEADQLVAAFSVFSMSKATAGESYQAAVVVDIVSGWHINSAKPYQDYLIPAEVELGAVDGITPSEVAYPEGEDAMLGEERMSVYADRVVMKFSLDLASNIQDGTYTLPVSVTFQPCNDRECRAPETLEVPLKIAVGSGGQPINEKYLTGAVALGSGSETATQNSDDTEAEPVSDLQQTINEHGFWGYFMVLGSAFLIGLVLSFSPCTYPMIPITVSIFAGQERSVGRGFFLSLIYVGTMALMYGIMGLVVSLVGGVFGAWLASPPVVIAMVVIFVIFSLSMFGLFELNVPSSIRQKLGTAKGDGGVVGSIVLGVVAALVVSPCVGPFVAGILLYIATSGSPLVGFLTLFVFALGLGTFFVVIGTFSSAISKLPQAGEWMEQVKKFFGFILLLMAVYFLRTLVSAEVTALSTAILLIAFGAFGGGLDRLTGESGFFARLKKFLGIIALLLGAYLLLSVLFATGFILPPLAKSMPAGGATTIHEETGISGWETDLEAGLARAKAEGKPVIIDTWATWCANCRVLESKTFSQPQVGDEARRFVAIKVQLETKDSPATLDFKSRFGLKTYTLPTTLLLDSQGRIKKKLFGVIGPDELVAEMKKVK